MSENEQNDSYENVSTLNVGATNKFFLKISRIYARSGISYGDIEGLTFRT